MQVPAGADGRIRWLLNVRDFNQAIGMALCDTSNGGQIVTDAEFELARETAPHEYAPFTEAQSAILALLSGMEC